MLNLRQIRPGKVSQIVWCKRGSHDGGALPQGWHGILLLLLQAYLYHLNQQHI